MWISLLRSPRFDPTDLGSLQKGYCGASIMPVEVMREILRRLPRLKLWNRYAQTEIAPLATMLGPDDQCAKPGSCGRAVLDVETRVVDDQMLSEAEVLAHGHAQMAGFKTPKRVVFVGALPKNPSGKLLERELRQTNAAVFGADA